MVEEQGDGVRMLPHGTYELVVKLTQRCALCGVRCGESHLASHGVRIDVLGLIKQYQDKSYK